MWMDYSFCWRLSISSILDLFRFLFLLFMRLLSRNIISAKSVIIKLLLHPKKTAWHASKRRLL